LESGNKGSLEVDGVLVHIGRKPNTEFLKGIVPFDNYGYILVNDRMETEIPGIFAAGDARLHSPMQIISACGDGAIAAVAAIRKISMQ